MSMDFLLENPGDPIVWRGPVLASYVGQFWRKVVWTDVDCMFVDMPPGTADIPLTVFESLPLDGIVVVTEPQELVESVVAKAVVMAKKLNVPIVAAVENQAYFICPDCGAKQYPYGKTDARKIAEKFGAEFYAEIPVDKNIAAQTDRGLIELFEGEYLDAVCEGLQKL
jgi:Mrp family chromosome partitioning ATPase